MSQIRNTEKLKFFCLFLFDFYPAFTAESTITLFFGQVYGGQKDAESQEQALLRAIRLHPAPLYCATYLTLLRHFLVHDCSLSKNPTSVVDPGPHGFILILVGWIWIRIQDFKNDHALKRGEGGYFLLRA